MECRNGDVVKLSVMIINNINKYFLGCANHWMQESQGIFPLIGSKDVNRRSKRLCHDDVHDLQQS